MKKNIENKTPSLLLLIVLVGFPQISETIFSPSLPSIAATFNRSMSDAQLTMSVYFIAFALGVLFFGRLSDKVGRRRAMLYGVSLYFVGNVLCLVAHEMSVLLIARFIQAFGASVGSVVTQTILRESFSGMKRHQLFAQISAVMAFTPAIGPFIGGFANHYFGVKMVFIVLIAMSIFIFCYTFASLPETAPKDNKLKPLWPLARRMATNRRLWKYSLLIGGMNGILFSYYTEAPFLFIEYFSLTSAQYGGVGMVVACASVAGAMCSKRWVQHTRPELIIVRGSAVLLSGALLAIFVYLLPDAVQMIGLLMSIFLLLFGVGIALPNCLSLALVDFQAEIGSASALLSLHYYLLVSAIVYGMSVVHNGTLLAMPLYMAWIGSVILVMSLTLLQREVAIKS